MTRTTASERLVATKRWRRAMESGLLVAGVAISLMGCSGTSPRTQPDRPPSTASQADGPALAITPPEKHDGPVWFSDAGATGIDFVHNTGISPLRPFPAANGSGIAGLDYDLDGFVDLYFLTGQAFPVQPKAHSPRNQLYRNLGNWTFVNVSSESRLDLSSYSAGVAVGDYNQDGFPDVYISCVGKNVFFENMGDGTFQEHKMEFGVENSFPTSVAMFDFNHDGFPDIYVCNYGEWNAERLLNRPCGNKEHPVYCNPESIHPARDMMLENDGRGGFSDVTKQVGIVDPIGRGQGIVAADMNDDGLVDFYLGNDLNANSFFVNSPSHEYRNITENSGVAYDSRGAAQAGMGVDAADVNGDGLVDLIVTNFLGDHNSIYLNAGDEFFNEQSARCGIAAEGQPYIGWGVTLTDFDLDSWCDLVLTNGHVDTNSKTGPHKQPALAWSNDQRGRFRFLGAEAGPHFASAHPGRALVVGDFDNDGDSDIVFGHQDAGPVLLTNNRIGEEDPEPASITLRLIGVESNREAVGASVRVTSAGRSQRYQIKGGGSYLSARDARLVVAVTDSAEVSIRWPNGVESTLEQMSVGTEYAVVEPVEADADVHTFEMKRP